MRRPSNLMADAPAPQAATRPAEPAVPTNYVELYGLSRPPFAGAGDGRGYILFNSHRRAFELIVDHLLRGEGPILLVGEEGIGKTEMLRAAADTAAEAGVEMARLFRPPERRLLEEEVATALGGSEPEAVRRHMVNPKVGPARRAAVIDDVDLLPAACMPILRALMEPRDEPAPALVLTASNGLRRPDMAQLLAWQRNTVRLAPLGSSEVGQYIERCLWLAGGTTRRLIEPEAIRMVAAQAGGVPGTINRLMDAVLTTGFVRGDTMISTRTVVAAIGPTRVRPAWGRAPERKSGDGVLRRVVEIASIMLFLTGLALFAYRAVEGSGPPAQPVAESQSGIAGPAPGQAQ
jgi:type II secretory pathway predicted ATPase ExeA